MSERQCAAGRRIFWMNWQSSDVHSDDMTVCNHLTPDEPQSLQSLGHAIASERSEGEDEELLRDLETDLRSTHHFAGSADHPAMKWRIDGDVDGAVEPIRERFRSLRSRLTSLERERGELEDRLLRERDVAAVYEGSWRDLTGVERARADKAESRVRALEEDAKRLTTLQSLFDLARDLVISVDHTSASEWQEDTRVHGDDRDNTVLLVRPGESLRRALDTAARRQQSGSTVEDEAHDG